MLKNGIKPNSATCPDILAILIGPPNWELSPDPEIIDPKYFRDDVETNQTSFNEWNVAFIGFNLTWLISLL